MKGALLLAVLLVAGVPGVAEAHHGIHPLLACGHALQDVCRVVCNLTDYLPFRVVQALVDCLPSA